MSEYPHPDDEPQPVPAEEISGGKLIPLRAADAGGAVAFEGHPVAPAYLDTTGTGEGARRDIIPGHLTPAHLPETLGGWAGKARYQLLYHGIRSPWHAIRLTGMAFRGAGRLVGRHWSWADAAHLRQLESEAVAVGRTAHHEALRAHKEGEKTRGSHWKITAA